MALIACAAKKSPRPLPAGDLYESDLFKKARSYAKQNSDRWFILSAKHHLLRPEEVVAPYEQTLNTMPKAEREKWAERVLEQLRPLLQAGDHVIVLAGQRYAESIVPAFQGWNVTVEMPLAGMRIGEQLQWLKNHLT